jgi:hypothetical protein
MFRNSPYGDGGGWSVDYPRADVNLSFRLSELTTTLVSKTEAGEFNHVVIRLTDKELFRCPFIMMTEPGGALRRGGGHPAARIPSERRLSLGR